MEIDPLLEGPKREGRYAECLKTLLKGIPMKQCRFIVALHSPLSMVRIILAPVMPKAELREAFRNESERYFSFSIEDSIVDFEILGETAEKGTKKLIVLAGALLRKTVEDTLALLKPFGIKPISILPAAAALQRFIEGSPPPSTETICFLDMGNGQSELMIVKENRPLFFYKVPIGGRHFTESMTEALLSDLGKTQLSFEEAEGIKRHVGIPAEGEQWLIENKLSAAQAFSMLRSPLEQLSSEVDRCFTFFREEHGGGEVDRVFLTGRGAELRGLSRTLSEKLGIEVEAVDPIKQLSLESQVPEPPPNFSAYTVALGAAFSKGKGINLLPAEIKEEFKRAFIRGTLQSFAASLILVFVFIYAGMRIQLSNYEKRIAVARLEVSSLEPEKGSLEIRAEVHQAFAEEPYWDDIFRELSNLTPSEIVLAKFSMANRQLMLSGKISSPEREKVLSDFIALLEKAMFKNVKLVRSRVTEEGAAGEFELNLWVD